MCSVHRARMSLKVFSIFSVLKTQFPCASHLLLLLGNPTPIPSIYMHHTATRSLAQVAGLFSMRGRWSFPRSVPVPDDEIWRPFGFRFPFTTIPCVLEDGRGVRLCYRWLSPCSFFVGLLSTWFCLQNLILISASTNVSNLFFVYAITFIMST
jgi:hypothetical protein